MRAHLVVPIRAVLLLSTLATTALGQSSEAQRGVRLFEDHTTRSAQRAIVCPRP